MIIIISLRTRRRFIIVYRKRTTSTQRSLLPFQHTQNHLMLLGTINTFRARYPSSDGWLIFPFCLVFQLKKGIWPETY